MGDIVFNIAKGRVNELFNRVKTNDPANSAIVMVILKTTATDATLKDFDTLAAILAGTSVEADFTNYARQVLTDADLAALSPDDGADSMASAIPQITISSAGGASNNTLNKVLFCYDPDTTGGTDSDLIPLTAHDDGRTTDGNDLIWNAGNIFNATDPV